MTFESPFVSVIVVNWNGMPYLEECVRSLLRLSYTNFEIIVVDNNSSDNSVDLLKQLSPKLTLIINEENLGFARGCNIGIKASKGDFIALFNNDAVADPEWLTELVTSLSRLKDAGAAGGPVYYCDQPTKIWFSGGRIDVLTGFSWNIGQNQSSFRLEGSDVDTLTGCAILIKRDLLAKIGYLDEGYFLYGEDHDLSTSIKRLRKDLIFVPTAIAWHKVSASKKKAPLFAYNMKTKSDLRFILKNYPLKFLASALIFRGFFFPLSEMVYFYKDPLYLLNATESMASNLRHLKLTIRERKRVQQLGKVMIRNRFKEFVMEASKRIREGKLYW